MAPENTRARGRRRRLGAASLAVAALSGTFITASAVTANAAGAATATVAGTQPAWATPAADRGEVAAGTSVTTTVYLASPDQAGLQQYAQDVSTPGNALYHRFLSTSGYQARFGSTQAQAAAVQAWLRAAGLRVTAVNGHEIEVSGTAAQTEAAYAVALHSYAVQGKTYRAPNADAKVPADLAADVLTIGGLNDMPVLMRPSDPVSAAQAEAQVTGRKPQMSKGADGSVYIGQTPCSSYYGQAEDTTAPAQNGSEHPYVVCGYVPSQMRSAYGVVPALTGIDGHGVTIAVVDAYGNSDILSDANTYAVNHGDPAFAAGQYLDTETPSKWYDQDVCGGPGGWSPEEHIDIEAVHAMAPGATVHYYGGNSCQNADLLAPLQQIADTHSADIVSNSWGEPVFSSSGNLSSSDAAAMDQTLMQMAVEGIEVNFSSGDCGAEIPTTGCGSNDTSTKPQADWPASDPWATAVGGTSVAVDKWGIAEWQSAWATEVYAPPASGKGVWSTVEWWAGGGGGTSALFSQPWYQRGVVPHALSTALPTGLSTASPMRVVPDVSMDADPYTGFLVGQTQTLPDGTTGYGESAWGGTSLASPLFAGLQADAMQLQGYRPIGFANPAIYARYGTPFYHDVTANGPGTTAFNDYPTADGSGTQYSVGFGDTQILKAANGYDDVSGVGTPSPLYLWSHLVW